MESSMWASAGGDLAGGMRNAQWKKSLSIWCSFADKADKQFQAYVSHTGQNIHT